MSCAGHLVECAKDGGCQRPHTRRLRRRRHRLHANGNDHKGDVFLPPMTPALRRPTGNARCPHGLVKGPDRWGGIIDGLILSALPRNVTSASKPVHHPERTFPAFSLPRRPASLNWEAALGASCDIMSGHCPRMDDYEDRTNCNSNTSETHHPCETSWHPRGCLGTRAFHEDRGAVDFGCDTCSRSAGPGFG